METLDLTTYREHLRTLNIAQLKAELLRTHKIMAIVLDELKRRCAGVPAVEADEFIDLSSPPE